MAPAAPAPRVPPASWVAVHRTHDDWVVRRWTGDASRRLAAYTRMPEGEPSDPVDVAWRDGTALVGTCCEPVPGTIHRAVGRLEPFDQGRRVDARRGGTLMARVDTYGYVGFGPGRPVGDTVHAVDVAVLPDGRVVALANPLYGMDPEPGPDAPALVLIDEKARSSVPLNRDYCAIVGLAGGHVGLLRTKAPWNPHAEPCAASRMDVVGLDGRIVRTVDLPTRAVHVSADDSGTYLLVTGADGSVRWFTLDGRGERIQAGRDVVLADW